MRTTLSVEDEALSLARAFASRHRISLGKAVSELIQRGARRPLVTRESHGLHVVDLPEDSPSVTEERVQALGDELA